MINDTDLDDIVAGEVRATAAEGRELAIENDRLRRALASVLACLQSICADEVAEGRRNSGVAQQARSGAKEAQAVLEIVVSNSLTVCCSLASVHLGNDRWQCPSCGTTRVLGRVELFSSGVEDLEQHVSALRPLFACRHCGDTYAEGYTEPCGGAHRHEWQPASLSNGGDK